MWRRFIGQGVFDGILRNVCLQCGLIGPHKSTTHLILTCVKAVLLLNTYRRLFYNGALWGCKTGDEPKPSKVQLTVHLCATTCVAVWSSVWWVSAVWLFPANCCGGAPCKGRQKAPGCPLVWWSRCHVTSWHPPLPLLLGGRGSLGWCCWLHAAHCSLCAAHCLLLVAMWPITSLHASPTVIALSTPAERHSNR